MCKDPFRKGITAWLALCETYLCDKVTPAKGNFRNITNRIMEKSAHEEPWFGIE
jgi:glutamine synthetase